MKRRIALSLLALALAGFGAACDSDGTDVEPTPTPPAVEPSTDTDLTDTGAIETVPRLLIRASPKAVRREPQTLDPLEADSEARSLRPRLRAGLDARGGQTATE